MTFRIVQDEQELEVFRAQAENYLSIRFPLDYLRNGQVTAFYSKEGRMIGGYALISQPPFRVLTSLPDEVLAASPHLKRVPMASLFEITAFWLAPECQQKRASFHLWFRMYRDAIALGKSHFIYSYSLAKPSLGRLYSICRPTVLFRGETKLLEGMARVERESVELSSMARAVFFPILRPRFLLGRFFRGH